MDWSYTIDREWFVLNQKDRAREDWQGYFDHEGFLTGCGFRSFHPGGAQFTMADGAVRFISESINMITFSALGTKAGNEVAGEM